MAVPIIELILHELLFCHLIQFLFGEEFKKAKPATLTLNDFSEIENLLEKCISDYNSNQEEIFRVLSKELPKLEKRRFVIDLKQYRRQYVAVINSKGEKEIWINCFCGEIREWNKWWKSNVIIVDDGGNCFFNLKVNLKTGKYYDLMVNGNA